MNSELKITKTKKKIDFSKPQLLSFTINDLVVIVLTESIDDDNPDEFSATVVYSESVHYDVGYHSETFNVHDYSLKILEKESVVNLYN